MRPLAVSHWRSAALFVAVTLVYVCCPIKGVGDLFWSLPTAVSILREGNAELDEYEPGFHHYAGAIERVNGHPRNFFPLGPALLALGPLWAFNGLVTGLAPLASPFPRVEKGVVNWKRQFTRTGDIDASFFFTTEMVLASLFMGLAAVFIQATASELLPWRWALLVTGSFAFGSAVWSTATRDLGQHGPSVLMLTLALWLVVRGRRHPGGVSWAGLFVALAYLMRPTNSLAVLIFALLVALRFPRRLPAFCALGALVAAVFFFYNYTVYGTILPSYYRPERVLPASGALFLEAAAGNLFSPARGLLVFSPVFAFSALGLWLLLRERATVVEGGLLGLLVLLHWLTVSSFPHWWAGHSYGPRYMTDLTPFLCFLLIPVVQRLRASTERPLRRQALGISFTAALLFSVFTHAQGATSRAAADWNATPMNVDLHPERLWDWGDPPFLRGLGGSVGPRPPPR